MAKKKKSRSSHSRHGGKPRLPRAMWKGSISFGLVNIPVRLYPAVRSKDIHFHLLHAKDKSRIHQEIVCDNEEKEVSRNDTVRGYEIAPGEHVVVRDEELDALAPRASRAIDLIQFVDISEIDPVFYEKPYYLVPEENAAKAYGLFIQALARSGKVGISKFVMRKKQYLAALRVVDRVLCLETMHFPDEIVPAGELQPAIENSHVRPREVEAAEQLIKSLTDEFDPADFRDDYREAVEELIQKKVEGEEVAVTPVREEEAPEVVDLMSALEASLAEAKKKEKKRKKAA